MSPKPWKLVLPALVLALALAAPLAAEEVAAPEVALEEAPEVVTPVPEAAPTEVPESFGLQPAPLRMTDCYSLSTCTPSFAACADWCYSQDCGVNYWDAGPQICYCGTKF